MRIYGNLDEIHGRERGCVAAVGNFDGVHLGHGAILKQAAANAAARGVPGLVMTFSVHPANRLRPHSAPRIIMKMEDRLALMARAGIQAALVLPFDRRLAGMEPAEFVDGVLINSLGITEVVAGEEWRFGKDRVGDMDSLSSMGRERGFSVTSVGAQMLEGSPVSSTRIRGALHEGDVGLAEKLLGRPHFARGTVERGEGRGRRLGFPTVNLACESVILPARGVYGAAFACDDRVGPAAVNIGSRPTFGSGTGTVEAHLVGVREDLYGRQVTIIFLTRLRDEIAFPDRGSLIEQIARDVERAEKTFDLSRIGEVPL